LRLVGVIATFERQILLPLNGRNLKDGPHVNSLPNSYYSGEKSLVGRILFINSKIIKKGVDENL
jgi:hypothetical protein